MVESTVFVKKFVHWFVEQKVRLERGKSYISALQNVALFLILFQGWGVPFNLQLILALIVMLVLWFIGYMDEKHIHGWQHENEYTTKLNPVMVRIEENTKKVE